VNQEALELWESCCFHARHVTRSVEDLGAAMYPPQVSGCNQEGCKAVAHGAET
jgi:hypothetical protein